MANLPLGDRIVATLDALLLCLGVGAIAATLRPVVAFVTVQVRRRLRCRRIARRR